MHVIALIEAIKGVLAVLAASGLALLGPAPLQRWVHILIARFELDPEHGALALFAREDQPGAVHWAAAAVMAYGILHMLEAWGLWRAKAWASWLGCLAATLYLPLDLYALWQASGLACDRRARDQPARGLGAGTRHRTPPLLTSAPWPFHRCATLYPQLLTGPCHRAGLIQIEAGGTSRLCWRTMSIAISSACS